MSVWLFSVLLKDWTQITFYFSREKYDNVESLDNNMS